MKKDHSPCELCPTFLVKRSNRKCRLKCLAILRYLNDLEQESIMQSSLGGCSYSIWISQDS